jgi:hypothetical protein
MNLLQMLDWGAKLEIAGSIMTANTLCKPIQPKTDRQRETGLEPGGFPLGFPDGVKPGWRFNFSGACASLSRAVESICLSIGCI